MHFSHTASNSTRLFLYTGKMSSIAFLRASSSLFGRDGKFLIPSGVHAFITSSPKKANLASLQHNLPAEQMFLSLGNFCRTSLTLHSLLLSIIIEVLYDGTRT